MVVVDLVSLRNFIKFVSENYCAEVVDRKVELVPFNNMQMKIIREDDYDRFPYDNLE